MKRRVVAIIDSVYMPPVEEIKPGNFFYNISIQVENK